MKYKTNAENEKSNARRESKMYCPSVTDLPSQALYDHLAQVAKGRQSVPRRRNQAVSKLQTLTQAKNHKIIVDLSPPSPSFAVEPSEITAAYDTKRIQEYESLQHSSLLGITAPYDN